MLTLAALAGSLAANAQVKLNDKHAMAFDLGYGVEVSDFLSSASATTLTGEELQQTSAANLAQALYGRLPGLTALSNGGFAGDEGKGASFNIRGYHTLNDKSILILVDGYERPIDRLSVEEVESKLTNSIPLGTVNSDIHLEWEEDFIFRRNGQRTIQAECDPNPDLSDATPKKVEADIRKAIQAIKLPQGYSMSWQGEGGSSGQAASSILGLFPMAFALILVIMLLLFNSWKQVLTIVFCLPFIVVGIVPALLLLGKPFTFIAILGAMGLVGMMIKNGIVLVDEINRLQKEEKQPAYNAVVNATVSRTSPVIMASLTTILGMAPLIPDPMYGSMAVCIMSGLAIGTLIILIFLPILYSTIFNVKKTSK